MARNEEKANSMLNRWLAYKQEEGVRPRTTGKRPTMTSSVKTVQECEKWRMQMLREIGRKVQEIQNESLGEQRIRDLNDEINRQLREKAHWERRIIELGGPNYRKYERIADDQFVSQVLEASGNFQEHYGHTYKYFGAARKLPGVKELFDKKNELQEKQVAPKRKRQEYKGIIDAEYFGFRDEDDSTLLDVEQEAEREAIDRAVSQWNTKQLKRDKTDYYDEEAITDIKIPSKEELEKRLLDKKKEELLKKYTSTV